MYLLDVQAYYLVLCLCSLFLGWYVGVLVGLFELLRGVWCSFRVCCGVAAGCLNLSFGFRFCI